MDAIGGGGDRCFKAEGKEKGNEKKERHEMINPPIHSLSPPPPPPPQQCTKHGIKEKCSMPNCTTVAQNRGLCTKHGARGMCSVAGCKNAGQSRGRCVNAASAVACSPPSPPPPLPLTRPLSHTRPLSLPHRPHTRFFSLAGAKSMVQKGSAHFPVVTPSRGTKDCASNMALLPGAGSKVARALPR